LSEDVYAKAGVSQGDADAAVASLVSALAASPPAESRQVLASGHSPRDLAFGSEGEKICAP